MAHLKPFSSSPAGRHPGSCSRLPAAGILFILGLVLPLPALEGCSDSSPSADSTLGGIEVTTVTDGDGAFPDSLRVLLDGGYAGSMGPNDEFMIPFLPPGSYGVALADEWEGCWMGKNLRFVTVEAKLTTPTTFLIRCR
jgi:hypothetical protein